MSHPTKTYSTDVRIISEEKTKGRLNIIKARLMAMVKLSDDSFTCIDEPTLKTWNISIPLATFKINPSHESKLSYGNKLPDGTRGQYFIYNFTIHVFATKISTDQLEAKDAQEYAEVIVKYLRRHNKDTNSGILDIFDITYRESDPEPHGTMRLSRVIITGKVLAERPWGTF